MPRNIVINPNKGRLVAVAVVALLLIAGGVWYYLNQTDYLGSEDSNAAFIAGNCTQQRKCGTGQVSVCRPIRCACTPPVAKDGGRVSAAIKKTIVVNADSNVCASTKDRYVKCPSTKPVKKTVQVEAQESELKDLNALKDSISAYVATIRKNTKTSATERLLWSSMNTSLRNLQQVIDEKSKALGSYQPTTAAKGGCTYSVATVVNNDTEACKSICANYQNQFSK